MRESRAPTVYLHIGLPKTGTSYLQNLLIKNRDLLDRSGVWTPDKWTEAHRMAITAIISQERLAVDDVGRLVGHAPASEAWNAFDEAVQSGRYKQIVISSEYFTDADPSTTRQRFEEHGISEPPVIIVFVRRQDRFFSSSYAQEVKIMGRTAPIPPRHRYHAEYDWAHFVDSWADVFGKDRMRVIGYDKAAAEGNAAERFFAAADCAEVMSEPNFKSIGRRVNEALPAALLEFKRIANAFGEFGLHQWLAEAREETDWSRPFRADPAFAELVLEAYRESNQDLVDRYLGGDRRELGLDDEPSEDGVDLTGKLSVTTVAKLLAFHVKRAQEERDSLRARIEQLEKDAGE